MQYELNQIITDEQPNYANCAVWCNENNAMLVAIGDNQYQIKEIPPPTQEELNQQRITQIHQELNDLDMKSVRAVRAIQAGTGTDEDKKTLTEIEKQVTILRTELSSLTILSQGV